LQGLLNAMQARADMEQAMRLSPRDPLVGVFHVNLGEAEIGLAHFDAAIDEIQKAIDSDYRPSFAYTNLDVEPQQVVLG
jgi:hypothetical protein